MTDPTRFLIGTRPLLRLAAIAAVLVLTACAVPDGVGTALQDTFTTSSDFAGNPLADAASVRPAPRDACEATAQNRARDIAAEGYDATLQQHVHDAALADCRAWSKRY